MDIVVVHCVLATVIVVMLWVLLEHAQMWIQIAQVIVTFVVQVTVQQFKRHVLATVTFVLVQVQHIIAQRVLLSVLILLAHVPVQAVAQSLIVSRVL